MYIYLIGLLLICKINANNELHELINNHRYFFNFGVQREESNNTLKVDILGQVFKQQVQNFKNKGILDLLFLLDASSSVGENNFKSEVKFIKKLLSDVVVDSLNSRISLVTFSSPDKIVVAIDEISKNETDNNKCTLFGKNIKDVVYSGGGTYTLGALKKALEILVKGRTGVPKILFLITDGYSNGGDPVPVANQLKEANVTIFTIGISNGNYKELYDISSSPGELHSYLLDSFPEFENLARRALHVDLQTGDYIPLGNNSFCNNLCDKGNCCDKNAFCSCGTTSGHYKCLCSMGYYGSGLVNTCLPCPSGSYASNPNLCMPCPDVHHITKVPAIGLESCLCKTGYKSTENGTCDLIECQKLSAPENGYFVKSIECPNIYNSACGIRCKVGYTLTGSSIRLCLENATWSGQNSICQIKTCQKLEAPLYGTINCSHPDVELSDFNLEDGLWPVDTLCQFGCKSGRTLIGSKQRICLPLAQWDGLRSSCKQIKCNKLPKINNAIIEPKSCLYGKQSFGKVCTIKCLNGFTIKGLNDSSSVDNICNGEHGNWNSSKIFTCIDTTPPVLNCPENKTIETLKGKAYGILDWISFNATDNSNMNVTVWSEPVIKGSQKFKIGLHNITYFARDIFGNEANCTYVLDVLDLEPPVFELCFDLPVYYLNNSEQQLNVTWNEPTVYDNSQNVTLKKSQNFGIFSLGTRKIVYTAEDFSNNSNVCILNITLEVEKCLAPNITFGNITCENTTDNELNCVVKCNKGFGLLADSEEYSDSQKLECKNGIWNNSNPECVATQVANDIKQIGTLIKDFKGNLDVCRDYLEPNVTKNIIKNDILNSLATDCKDTNDCNINAVIKCIEEVENSLRTKRQVKSKHSSIKVNYNVSVKNISSIRFENSSFDGWSVSKMVTNITCPKGTFLRKRKCYQCPLGTFHNVTTKYCQSCPLGTYNNKTGQSDCIKCPDNYSTRRFHAKSLNECAEKCAPGTIAHIKRIKQHRRLPYLLFERTTLQPYCTSCPIGQFQPEYGQLKCLQCPDNQTTSQRGSKSLKECQYLNACAENTCLNGGICREVNNFGYSCICPENFIGNDCEFIKDPCASAPCLNYATCKPLNSTSYICGCLEGYFGKNCEFQNITECSLNCQNNSTCVSLDGENEEDLCLCSPGFTGKFCEENQSFCFENLCENGGTCLETPEGFICNCPQGYFGHRCSYIPCDFNNCPENFICINHDSISHSFKCVCPFGYEGDNCDKVINFCSHGLCENNSTCIASFGNYLCKCHRGFWGQNCEISLPKDYVLSFSKGSTTDFVLLKGPDEDLKEASVCTWIQTSDSQNYGTLLSYATRNFQNAFTITDYNGMVIYVNNDYKVTDVSLNDGFWHHFCLTWNISGTFKIYIDSKLTHTGYNLSTNTSIPRGGILILGQEQDTLGGSFSQSETFIGNLSYMEIYNKFLTAEEIFDIMTSCDTSNSGSLYDWSEFGINVKGDVEIKNALNFCNGCSQPKAPINGFVNVISSVAYYGCDQGFALDKFKAGRKCLKAGRWEGSKDPICMPINCGHPGPIKNGYIVGSKYLFSEEIFYKCNSGYAIKGIPVRRCGENGLWEPAEPKCLNFKCLFKYSVSYGNITLSTEYDDIVEVIQSDIENVGEELMDIGTELIINCKENHKLIGESTLRCLSNGSWNFDLPQCLPKVNISCKLDQIPEPPSNSYLDQRSLDRVKEQLSNFVEYSCKEGFVSLGANSSFCILDGYWTELKMHCQELECPHPPNLSHLNLAFQEQNKTFQIGQQVVYECLPGYKSIGSEPILSCLSSGEWDIKSFYCIRISCKKPTVNENTRILGTTFFYQDKVQLICSGELFYFQCSSSGVWIPVMTVMDSYKKCFS